MLVIGFMCMMEGLKDEECVCDVVNESTLKTKIENVDPFIRLIIP